MQDLESYAETVFSEVRNTPIEDLSEANEEKKARHLEECETCAFFQGLDKKAQDGKMSCIDVMIKDYLERMICTGMAIAIGELPDLIHYMRAMFLVGVKVGRLQQMDRTFSPHD